MDNTRPLKHALNYLEEEEIVDAPGNDGNATIPEQVKQPNPWRKMVMTMAFRYVFSTQKQNSFNFDKTKILFLVLKTTGCLLFK
jgi:hypothetical protein